MLDATMSKAERREADAELFATFCRSQGVKSTSNTRAQRIAINFMLEAFHHEELNGVIEAIEQYQDSNTLFPDRQDLSEAADFIASEASELSEWWEGSRS